MKPFFALLSALALFAVPTQGAPIKIASLSTILTDLAKQVGGDKVEVAGLVQPGIDPHEFQPSPQDIKKISQANLVLASGLGMEGYLTKLEQSAGGNAKWVEVGNRLKLPKFELPAEEGSGMERDPHWFHSISAVRQAADVIRDELSALSPADKDYFAKRAADYEQKLDALAKWAHEQVNSLPTAQRKLVTSHDAFQYFAHEFGFTIYSITGISTEDQPSTRKVAELIQTIRDQKVKAVFFENTQNPKVIEEITRETGSKVGGELYADGLGTSDSDAGTYESMVHHNIATIVKALK